MAYAASPVKGADDAGTALGRVATDGNQAASALANLAAAAKTASSGLGSGGGGGGGPYAGGGGGGGGGGPVHVHYHTHIAPVIQGSVVAENDLLDRLQELQLNKADRNWQGGWQHPDRAG